MKKAIFTFGRMNPPTVGHEKLVNKIRTVARMEKGDPYVFLSHSHDKKKNPLTYNDKLKFAQKAFGKIVVRTSSNTIVKILQELNKKYKAIVLVVGSDRIEPMRKLINDYNGKEYNFDSIEVVSSGDRDPDADGVEGMSASKMREAVKEGDFQTFVSGLPPLIQRDGKKIFDLIRKGMKL